MFDDEDFDNNNNENNFDDSIPGQIDVSELFVREDEEKEDSQEQRESGIAQGQLSFDFVTGKYKQVETSNEQDLSNKQKILNKITKSNKNVLDEQNYIKRLSQKARENRENDSPKQSYEDLNSNWQEQLNDSESDFENNFLDENTQDSSNDFNYNNITDNSQVKQNEFIYKLQDNQNDESDISVSNHIQTSSQEFDNNSETSSQEFDNVSELDNEDFDNEKDLEKYSHTKTNMDNDFNESEDYNYSNQDKERAEVTNQDFESKLDNSFQESNYEQFDSIQEEDNLFQTTNEEGDSFLDLQNEDSDITSEEEKVDFDTKGREDLSTNKNSNSNKNVTNGTKNPSFRGKKPSSLSSSSVTNFEGQDEKDSEQIKNERLLQKSVDLLNRDFEEVSLNVGSNAFGVSGKIDNERLFYDGGSSEVVDGIIYKNIETILHESMIPYSEHVIIDRALPRVEDGLKPVQRRILYDMLELGVTPDSPFKKSARIVGDCLGKYHPHGDSSVYQALVNMAQEFSCSQVLITGQGNFGSIDGDPPAAMRYTEVKLSPLAMELLRDLDKNTVKWELNFDDTLKEPVCLPGRFPNLLVNGSMGIAVGLATNIPPHNLAEVIDGVIAYIDNPKISLAEMMKFIKGPDFPTGAYILDSSELVQAYKTGKGKIYIRAKIHLEGEGSDRKSFVITEIPYGVNKSTLLRKILELKEEDKYDLGGIAEIRDESDRQGMRAVIRLKKDASVNKIYNSLLKYTDLQCTFGINMVAIAGGKPKQMGLLDIISYYSQYQREIIVRRSKFELSQAEERAHILEGLIIAIKNIDAVVKIIKTSKNSSEAKVRLIDKFKLSDRQAQAILDMRLARLTSLEVYKLEEELKSLHELIKYLKEVLASPKKQFEVVKKELFEIRKKYKKDRLTKFAKESAKISVNEDLKKINVPQNIIILKALDNSFKLIKEKNYFQSSRDIKEDSTLADINVIKFDCLSNSKLLCFTSLGNCFKINASQIGECKFRGRGVAETDLFKELEKDEHIVAIFNQDIENQEGNLMFYTKFGMVKKTPKSEYNLLKNAYQAIKLKDDDRLIKVESELLTNYNLVFVTSSGMVLNAKTDDIPVQGRVAGGVKGINLAEGDYCLSIDSCVNNEGEIVVVTQNGLCKRVITASIDPSARYRKGIKLHSGEKLAFSCLVTNPKEICLFDKNSNFFSRSTDLIKICSKSDKAKPFDKTKKTIPVSKVGISADI